MLNVLAGQSGVISASAVPLATTMMTTAQVESERDVGSMELRPSATTVASMNARRLRVLNATTSPVRVFGTNGSNGDHVHQLAEMD